MTAIEAAKWAVALLGLLAVVPSGLALRRFPKLLAAVPLLLGFLPFVSLSATSINPISYEHYRGDARGLELTALDLLLWTYAVALPKRKTPMPLKRTALLYLLATLVSVHNVAVPIYSLFGVWKLIRVLLAMRIVAGACEDRSVPPMLLRGMGAGIVLEALLCSWQHFVSHIYQARGNLSHQNTLTMLCSLVAPIALALMLSRRNLRFALAVLISALVCVIFGLSRGSLIAFSLSLVLVFLASAAQRLTPRKMGIAGVALLAALAVGIKAAPTIIKRFETAPETSGSSRIQFQNAAKMMLADHPLGIGINQFSYAFENEGYAERVGYLPDGSIVHNIYLLTAAELGYLGLAAYLAMLATLLAVAALGVLHGGDDVRAQVLLGCCAALTVTYAQGSLEWIFRQTVFAQVFFMLAGMIGALSRQLKQESRLSSGAALQRLFVVGARRPA